METTAPANDTIPGLSLKIPGEEPVSTISRLNKLLNDGHRFSAVRVVGGERVRIVAFHSVLREDACSVVIGLPHQTRFADILSATIKRV